MSNLTLEELTTLARDAGWPDPPLAAAIAMAESGGDIGAQGDPHGASGPVPNGTSKSYGLWQIDTVYHPGLDNARLLTDAAYNAMQALLIYQARKAQTGNGYSAWSTYNSGAYKRWYNQPPSPPSPVPAVGASVTGTLVATFLLAGITYLVVRHQ